MHSFIFNFLWYIFNLSVKHFWRFVIDQQERFGSTNFSTRTAFSRRNCLSFFLLFFLCQFLSYFFRRIFRFLPSLTHSSPPPSLLQTRGNDQPFVRLFRVVGLRKKYRLFCGLKDFALIDILVSWKL